MKENQKFNVKESCNLKKKKTFHISITCCYGLTIRSKRILYPYKKLENSQSSMSALHNTKIKKLSFSQKHLKRWNANKTLAGKIYFLILYGVILKFFFIKFEFFYKVWMQAKWLGNRQTMKSQYHKGNRDSLNTMYYSMFTDSTFLNSINWF